MTPAKLGEIERTIRQVVGFGDFPLHAPHTSIEGSSNLFEAIRQSTVSVGEELEELALEKLRAISGVEGVTLTSSGTSALHLALLGLGVMPGDCVICPSVSFVATANAILYCGAEPIFLDVESDSVGLCPEQLRSHLSKCQVRGPKASEGQFRLPSAIVVVAVFGLVPKINELEIVAAEFGVPLLIDGAGALGSKIGNDSILARGTASITSFNGNKIVTSGGGGAVFSSDRALVEKCHRMARVSKLPHQFAFEHVGIGYNYRMPAINAALLIDQLENFTAILRAKRKLHSKYSEAFGSIGVETFEEAMGTHSNYWLNSINLESSELDSTSVCTFLNSRGLGVRPLWNVLPDLLHLKNFFVGNLENARSLLANVVSLPSSYTIEARDV